MNRTMEFDLFSEFCSYTFNWFWFQVKFQQLKIPSNYYNYLRFVGLSDKCLDYYLNNSESILFRAYHWIQNWMNVLKNEKPTKIGEEEQVHCCDYLWFEKKIEHPLNIKIRYGMSMRCAVFIPSGILSIEWS